MKTNLVKNKIHEDRLKKIEYEEDKKIDKNTYQNL